MPNHFFRSISTALLVVLLSACATTHSPPATLEEQLQQHGLVKGDSLQRLESFNISGWSYLDERHVLIDGGPGRRYLVETRNDCNELAFANYLGYTSTAGALTRFDRLLSRSSSGWPIDCSIHAIYQLESVALATTEPGE